MIHEMQNIGSNHLLIVNEKMILDK